MISKEMRLLAKKWETGTSWPLRLEWIEINNIRGWNGQRVDFKFPIVAIVGENGSGKSTILQSAASIYNDENIKRYASNFFPDTAWDKIENSSIRFCYKEGNKTETKSIRKKTSRWKGNDVRPQRRVEYIDLRRIQPIGARVGYNKIAKANALEDQYTEFDDIQLGNISSIIGKTYKTVKISTTIFDASRKVPVLECGDNSYSGFHQGAGEVAIAELLQRKIENKSIVLIDEIETSLHPRAQRRLMRTIAEICRLTESQIILTTHSPYILSELPNEGRCYIFDGIDGKNIITGVSPDFAMTMMDEENHPECDIYVEDERAKMLVKNIIIKEQPDIIKRVCINPYGTASVGQSLGIMKSQNRFSRPTLVYLDGDQSSFDGCLLLPGGDSPERVVFEGLQLLSPQWGDIHIRLDRSYSEVADALNRAMTTHDPHSWLKDASNAVVVSSDSLWDVMTSEWAKKCFPSAESSKFVDEVRAILP